MVEEWRDIIRYEGLYRVSSNGKVFSVEKSIIRRTTISRCGYEIVCIYNNRKQWAAPVHRLVAEAFIPNPENKPCVNHINGIKTDNRVENLEWATHSENSLHASRNGLRIYGRGDECKISKLTTADVLAIASRLKAGESVDAVAKLFSISRDSICLINAGKSWSHVTGGRVRGAINGARAKLTTERVEKIIERIHAGDGDQVIGDAFGVHRATINSIRAGKSWKHVSNPKK